MATIGLLSSSDSCASELLEDIQNKGFLKDKFQFFTQNAHTKTINDIRRISKMRLSIYRRVS